MLTKVDLFLDPFSGKNSALRLLTKKKNKEHY
jgi:hypothetical protein